MTRKKIEIFTDSRGKDLEPFLARQLPQHIAVKVHVKRGATLEKLIYHLKQDSDPQTDLIIIAAGICNLTRKDAATKTLTYIRSEENITSIKDTITSIAGELQDKLILATIPPASLLKYYTHFNKTEPPPHLTTQQKELLQDTEELNQYIKTLNKAADKQTIDLHSQCFNTALDQKKKGKANPSRRRKIFLEKLLTDGVHPNSTLQHKWFSRFQQCINQWVHNISSSDTDTDGPGPWDYKRGHASANEPGPSTSRA